MTKSSINATHGSTVCLNGHQSEANCNQQDGPYQRLHQERIAPRSSLHLQDPAEPVNARIQNPLHVAQPARDAVSLHPNVGAAPGVTVQDPIPAKDLAGIGGQFSAEKR